MVIKFGVHIPKQSLICTAYAVYSDSFSYLQAVAGLKTDHPFVAKVIHKMNQLATDGYDIHLCWVPSCASYAK